MPLTIIDCDHEIERLWKLQRTAGEFEREAIMMKIDMYLESRHQIRLNQISQEQAESLTHV